MDSLGETLRLITTTLERLHIPYFVGGSVASSIRGVWRTTLGVDLIASVGAQQATALVGALGPEWYADPEEMRRSIELGRAFNLIHLKNATKVDIFPACDEFHSSQLRRATVVRVGSAQIPCRVATAEDSLLAKLRWYREGGEVSTIQWDDLLTLVRSNPSLDSSYLQHWASRLGVASLLEKVQSAADQLL